MSCAGFAVVTCLITEQSPSLIMSMAHPDHNNHDKLIGQSAVPSEVMLGCFKLSKLHQHFSQLWGVWETQLTLQVIPQS